MKQCCKSPANWKHDGTRDKKVIDRGTMVNITQHNYLTCTACGNKMAMFVTKNVLDVKKKERITLVRP